MLLQFLPACGVLPGPSTEEVRQTPNKAVYRASEEVRADDASPAVSARQKIPGE